MQSLAFKALNFTTDMIVTFHSSLSKHPRNILFIRKLCKVQENNRTAERIPGSDDRWFNIKTAYKLLTICC